MIKALIRTLLHANHFAFLVGVCALAIVLSGLLLLLVIAIPHPSQRRADAGDDQSKRIAWRLWHTGLSDVRENDSSSDDLVNNCLRCLLSPEFAARQQPPFVIGEDLILSVSAFAESIRRLVKKETDGGRGDRLKSKHSTF
jgi:hypothetical protein